MECNKETVDMETSCGIKSCHPKFIRTFEGPKTFCFFLCVIMFCQTMSTGGLLTGSLRDIEKQFGFTSKQTGFIVVSNDIAALFAVPIVSFYGERGHKPRWIGFGALLCAIGALGTALPKFLAGKYTPSGSITNAHANSLVCSLSNTTRDYCIKDTSISSSEVYLLVFSTAQMILGVGATPLLTLGISYIDENVNPNYSPVYMGIIYSATFIGSTFGLILAGLSLKTFVDIDLPPKVKISMGDQRWVGAWWLGFAYVSIVIFCMALVIFLFPRKLKGREIRAEAIARGELKGADNTISINANGLWTATKYLLKDKCFIFAVLGVTATTVFGAGLGSSFPKFLILKFGASTDIAAIASGSAIMPSMFFGIMAGSVIMRKLPLKDSIPAASKLCVAFSVMLVVLSGIFMIPGCNEPDIVGAEMQYRNETLTTTLDAVCNEGCNCDRSVFNPGCGSDGRTYYSPCYAGCKTNISENVYGNCSCISDTPGRGAEAKDVFLGECNRKCKNLYIFLAAACSVALMAFLKATPHKMIILRLVPENQRSYALGIQLLIVRSLGFIPSPVIIGAVIDSNCVLWAKSPCGKTGSCYAYQNRQFSENVAVFSAVCGGVSILSYALVWYFYKESEPVKFKQSPEMCFTSTETISTNV